MCIVCEGVYGCVSVELCEFDGVYGCVRVCAGVRVVKSQLKVMG